jgi:hypothetical protein
MSIGLAYYGVRSRIPIAVREHYYGAPRNRQPRKRARWTTNSLSRPRDFHEVTGEPPQSPIVQEGKDDTTS